MSVYGWVIVKFAVTVVGAYVIEVVVIVVVAVKRCTVTVSEAVVGV